MARRPATTDQEWQTLLQSPTTGFIRTHEDWDTSLTAFSRVVQLVGASSTHPVAGLDTETLEAFTNSLIFRGGGLAHADYSMLQEKLTELQFQQLWECFGIAASLFRDYRDRSCAGEGSPTCASKLGSLCLSNC